MKQFNTGYIPTSASFLKFDPHDQQKDRAFGVHLLAEFWDCKVTEDKNELEKIFTQAAIEAKNTPLSFSAHKFDPHGITAVLVLAESHISVHSWPEIGYAAIDIYTCGQKTFPKKALQYLETAFTPSKVDLKEIDRGVSIKEKISDKKQDINLKIDMDKSFGQELILNIYECNPKSIKSGDKIVEFTDKLCKLIDMKKYGKPFIERFAEHSKFAAGYTVAQPIETSLISGHFSEFWSSAYINIFSCKEFDEEVATKFTSEFFEAKSVRKQVIIR